MSETTINYIPKFNIKTNNVNEIKALFGTVSSLNEEPSLSIDNEGIYFRTMDPLHVALIDIRISANNFEKYQVDHDGYFSLNSDEIVKYLRTLDKNDSLEISLNDNEMIEFKTRSSMTKFKINEASDPFLTPLPKLAFDTRLVIDLKTFKKMVKKCMLIDDYLIFKTNDQRFEMSAINPDRRETKEVLEKGMMSLKDLDVKYDTEAMYSSEYISTLIKPISSDIPIQLEFSSRRPLKMTITINPNFIISYYLAPRVEN